MGELFVRGVVAYEVAARMRYLGEPLSRAASAALATVKRLGGSGGLVAVDRRGNIAMPFNSQGMYRAAMHRDGRRLVAIYR
jgi:beta-aspartyl-peptidase (threonine type)